MARISLLFYLALVLALGSLFLSVSGHAPPVPQRKQACPKTVSELQTLPFTQITEILNRKEQSAPKTAEFKAMFTMCKDYVAYLGSLYKFENPIVDVLGIAKARYALMNKAILAAQASVSGKVDKKTSLKLKKSYADLTKGFFQIKATIVKISAKHEFNADAKITAQESKKLNHAMIKFKNSINAFMNVVYNLEKDKMNKIGHHARSLKEDQDDGRVLSVFESFFNKFGGYLGGKTHGRELAEAESGAESIYEKISNFFGGYLGGQTHRRELYIVGPAAEAPAGVNAAAPSREHVEHVSQSDWDKYIHYYFGGLTTGKAKERELYIVGPAAEAPAGVNAAAPTSEHVEHVPQIDWYAWQRLSDLIAREKGHRRGLYSKAPAGGEVKGSFKDFFNVGFGGKVQYDAAGKIKVGGGDGFRSLNRAHYKHIASTEV